MSRVLALMLAVHFLNFSIDTADPLDQRIKEDLSYNDIESLAELVLEKVLLFNNAIAEYDEPESDESQNFAEKKLIDFSFLYRCSFSFDPFPSVLKLIYADTQEIKYHEVVRQLFEPPPRHHF